MSGIEEYLRRVARGLAGMDPRVREDVLRELRAHLHDSAAETDEVRAVSVAEPPEALARRYKEMYGYGKAYQALFVALSAVLAVFTLPLFLFLGEGTLAIGVSLAFLGILVAYLMWVAVAAGSTAGLRAGIAACATRFGALAALGAVAGAVVEGAGGWVLFTATSLLLILLGWLPGRAREKWGRREVSL